MSFEKSTEPINKDSILWADLYKFTMQWAIIKNFPEAKVVYEFVDRANTDYPKGFASELRKVIDSYRNKTLSKQRKSEFAEACPFLPAAYFDFLEGYRYDPSEVGVVQNGGQLKIQISGYWYRTVLWETTLMADICELYYKMTEKKDTLQTLLEVEQKSKQKIDTLYMNAIQCVDFGTRRAKSKDVHIKVVDTMSSLITYKKSFIGSSNVELSLYNKIKPIGTYAHEWVSGIGAMFGYAHANKIAMEFWVKTYNGNLGIALPDTFTTDAFLEDFDSKYANLFTGVRHDSGCAFEFTDKIIEHYKSLSIDPTTKTIVYSDALNTQKAIELQCYRKGEIRKSFGIGTYFTNDIDGVKPMNIVIKLFEINGLPAIKLSDSPSKNIGEKETINHVKWLIKQRQKNNSKY